MVSYGMSKVLFLYRFFSDCSNKSYFYLSVCQTDVARLTPHVILIQNIHSL